MTKRIRLNINLPFAGFYGSIWGDELDREESDWVEYEVNEREEGERQHPPELRLTEGELVDILMSHTSYRASQQILAKDITVALNDWASDALGLPLGLTFEALVSPRYYNFETDRLFADVDLKVMRELFRRSKDDGHVTLRGVIEGRFTSYDGFSSFYETDLSTWLAKPLRDWDHNELGTLLLAALKLVDADFSEFRMETLEDFSGNGVFASAWKSGVDWDAVEQAREAARSRKLEDLMDTDPDRWRQLIGEVGEVPCIRCPATPDLFDGAPHG